MYWVIGAVEGDWIYHLHDKIYINEKQARNALEVMQRNKKLGKGYKVFKVKRFVMDEVD